MGTFKDLTGLRSGTLVAQKYLGNSKWQCKCDVCSNIVEIDSYWFNKNIQLGRNGCKHSKSIEIGDRFGLLTVESQAEDYVKPKSGAHEKQWKCICVCGRETIVVEDNLKALKTITCGRCSTRVSLPEKSIVFYLFQHFDVVENYRPNFLNGKEIDIYIPSLKLGIEYDGERWHDNLQEDINKNHLCKQNDIVLLRIREPKLPVSSDLYPYIITSKPTTSGSHMTEPIKKIFEYISNHCNIQCIIDIDCLRDNAEICKTLISNIKSNSLAELFPRIAQEWDYIKNAPLTPDLVAASSGKKAYWICSNGHSYSSVIASRTGQGCGCPICSGRGAAIYRNGKYIGEHSLQTERPDLAVEFNEEKNGMSADNIAVSSDKKVWWKCSICNFEWESKINNRTSTLHTGCPQCAKTQNKSGNANRLHLVDKNGSLADHYPVLCLEWDYTKNDLLPQEVNVHSNFKVWWKCSNGHSYQASIINRVKGSGCPYCSGRLAIPGKTDFSTKYPELLAEWDYDKNSMNPIELTFGSSKIIHWKCIYCGKEYEQSIDQRRRFSIGCKECRRKNKKK